MMPPHPKVNTQHHNTLKVIILGKLFSDFSLILMSTGSSLPSIWRPNFEDSFNKINNLETEVDALGPAEGIS
jgi:hypothetical protein